MSLVVVTSPQSESDLALMLCLLEANAIPALVHNNGFGGLRPGPQIALYNTRRILVPTACAEDALETLSILGPSAAENTSPPRPERVDRLRMFLEFLVFGWFVPGYRRRRQIAAGAPQDDCSDAAVEDDAPDHPGGGAAAR